MIQRVLKPTNSSSYFMFGPRETDKANLLKSTTNIIERDCAGLERFLKDMLPAEAFCICRDIYEKNIGRVWQIPWEKAFIRLGLTTEQTRMH